MQISGLSGFEGNAKPAWVERVGARDEAARSRDDTPACPDELERLRRCCGGTAFGPTIDTALQRGRREVVIPTPRVS